MPTDAAPLQFEESPFLFSVMESDPVAHMVGVVATEASDVPVWFEITGTTPPSMCDDVNAPVPLETNRVH